MPTFTIGNRRALSGISIIGIAFSACGDRITDCETCAQADDGTVTCTECTDASGDVPSEDGESCVCEFQNNLL